MKHIIPVFLLFVILSLAFPVKAGAQVFASAGVSAASFQDPAGSGRGATVSFGRAWRLGMFRMNISDRRFSLDDVLDGEGEPLPFDRATISVSYLWRLWGNGSHSLDIYAGLGAFGGMDLGDEVLVWDSEKSLNTARGGGSPVAGLFPEVQAEAFIFDRLAVYASAAAPYCLSAREKVFVPEIGAGLRIYF